MHKTGAVEQHVQRRQCDHQRLNGRFVQHVQHCRLNTRHAFIGLEQFGVDVGRPDLRALGGQRQGRGLANALPGGGDQGAFPFESHVISFKVRSQDCLLLTFPQMMTTKLLSYFLRLACSSRVQSSRDQAGGALSSAAVLRGDLGSPTPPLCRCAERATDLILRTWRVSHRCTPTLLAAQALGVSGAAASRRRPKAGGQPRSHLPQVPGRTKPRPHKTP